MADKNERLGKGLSALFGEKGVDVPPIGLKDSPLTELEISKINVNPYQPREEFDSLKLKELSDSIKEKGVLQPITVKNSNKEGIFDLISGERRLRAAQMAGLKTIPAFIYTREYKDERAEMLELALIENIQREDLNPMELSNSFLRLIDEIGLTQEEVAKKVSKDRSTVANFLRLQRLPDEIKNSLRKNDITEAHARMILRLEDRKEQLDLWNRIVSEKLSVRKLEDITRSSAKPKKKKSSAGSQKWDPYLEKLEDRMRNFFGTRVKIVSKTNSSGHIIIEFYSNDDLDRIIEKCE
ncbi:MAG: ParB/RepB/Spo0J family partition protein [Ignavibacteriae bacterium]|nr:ParB/RepB/Spo0J family partition protein [Ignavibacteriota bacterium]